MPDNKVMSKRWLMTMLCALIAPAGELGAQPAELESAQPLAMRRIVHRFDFEERARGNFTDMPMHWNRVRETGFPRYTTVGFDTEMAHHESEHSLHLALDGGSAGAELSSGVLAVIPLTDYVIDGYVRTRNAQHTRARLVARYLDSVNRPLSGPAGSAQSPLMVANDGWTYLKVRMPRAPRDAAWLVLRVELLQPPLYRDPSPDPLDKHELARHDLDAEAWFDNLTVYRIPRIEVRTQHPAGVVRHPQRPKLTFTVQDPLAHPLVARATVYDHTGMPVDHSERDLDYKKSYPWDWSPTLPRLGWYRVALKVYRKDMHPQPLIGQAEATWLWLPPRRSADARDRFLISAEGLPPAQRPLMGPLLDALTPHTIVLDMWDPDTTLEELIDPNPDDPTRIGLLLQQHQRVILSMSRLPAELARQTGTDPDQPLDLFSRDPKIWQPYLQTVFSRFGHRVSVWQFGPSGSDIATRLENPAELYNQIDRFLRQYVTDPTLVMPWNALHEMDPRLPARAYAMRVPVSVRPSVIPTYVESWPKDRQITLMLETPDAQTTQTLERAEDLALRMIHGWRSGARRLGIAAPWRRGKRTDGRFMPEPLLAVWDNVAGHLAGRRFVGELNLHPNLRALMLENESGGGGVLVAWTLRGAQTVQIDLGGTPEIVDVWGNRRAVPMQDSQHVLSAGTTPLFVEAVDMNLLKMRAAFALDEPFLPAVHAKHRRKLTVINPWPYVLNGRLRFLGPERWKIQPELTDLSIPAGGKRVIDIELSFPASEPADFNRLVAELDYETHERRKIELWAPTVIGLRDVRLERRLTVEPRPEGPDDDVVVTLTVTNTGERTVSFYGFVAAPGYPKQQRLIASLPPNQTAIKRFRFKAAAKRLGDQRLRVGVRQINGPAALTYLLDGPAMESDDGN